MQLKYKRSKQMNDNASRIATTFFLTLSIPALLALGSFRSANYRKLERQVEGLEKKQVELIESNRKLITEISVLSSADRIEKMAAETLGMRKAATNEIIRIEMKER
jgi:cell division protein FtsL